MTHSLLVLDMDETLIHTSTIPDDSAAIQFSVMWNDATYQVYTQKRPFLDQFLETVSKFYEIAIFTAARQPYADGVLNAIDPHGQWFKKRYYYDDCIHIADEHHVKDLGILGHDLAHTVFIDDRPKIYSSHINNVIKIVGWTGNTDDTELIKLIPRLEELSTMPDVRPTISRNGEVYTIINFPPIEEVTPSSENMEREPLLPYNQLIKEEDIKQASGLPRFTSHIGMTSRNKCYRFFRLFIPSWLGSIELPMAPL